MGVFLMVSFVVAVLLGIGVAVFQMVSAARHKVDVNFSLTRTWLFAITCGVAMFVAAGTAGDLKSLELTDYFLFSTPFGWLAEGAVSLTHRHREKIIKLALIIPVVFGVLFGVWGSTLPA